MRYAAPLVQLYRGQRLMDKVLKLLDESPRDSNTLVVCPIKVFAFERAQTEVAPLTVAVTQKIAVSGSTSTTPAPIISTMLSLQHSQEMLKTRSKRVKISEEILDILKQQQQSINRAYIIYYLIGYKTFIQQKQMHSQAKVYFYLISPTFDVFFLRLFSFLVTQSKHIFIRLSEVRAPFTFVKLFAQKVFVFLSLLTQPLTVTLLICTFFKKSIHLLIHRCTKAFKTDDQIA